MSRPYAAFEFRTWYHVDPDEAALVALTRTKRTVFTGNRRQELTFYDNRHTPEANNFVMSCYRIKLDALIRAREHGTAA